MMRGCRGEEKSYIKRRVERQKVFPLLLFFAAFFCALLAAGAGGAFFSGLGAGRGGVAFGVVERHDFFGSGAEFDFDGGAAEIESVAESIFQKSQIIFCTVFGLIDENEKFRRCSTDH